MQAVATLNETSAPRAPFTRVAVSCVVLAAAVLLAGCQSSRFDSGGYAGAQPRRPAVPIDDEPLPAPMASSRVESSPLPPAPGTVVAPLPGEAGAAPGQQASLGAPAAPTPAAPPPASRSSAIGKWQAKEASGSCSVTLSSTPALDLYRAGTAGCANKDLQSVNAWEFRDGEVYLYARGGVVARLRDSGGQFNGVIAKSGAPLSLSK